jgi:hypothetical protein
MARWDYECRLCREVVADSEIDMTNSPCGNACCEGVLRRVWAIYVAPVPGAGGSPGHAVRGDK